MKPLEHATPPASESRRSETFQHKLEQFNPGMVWLDEQGHVTAFNDVALQILGPAGEQSLGVKQDKLFGIDVVQLHPEKSRDKLRFLLHSRDAGGCPVKSPPPVAMMINIPDRILMIKVSKMSSIERCLWHLHDLLRRDRPDHRAVKAGGGRIRCAGAPLRSRGASSRFPCTGATA